MDKKRLIELALAEVEREFASLVESARAAHEAATHEESAAEDKHDTRAIEASYLAGAQSARVAELKRLISVYRTLHLRAFAPDEAVDVGALVELEHDGKPLWVFLIREGGGMTVESEGRKVRLISPGSPLGEALVGREAGDAAEVETLQGEIEYGVIGVY